MWQTTAFGENSIPTDRSGAREKLIVLPSPTVDSDDAIKLVAI